MCSLYFGGGFAPLSLLGLFFRGTPAFSSMPLSAITVIVPVRNGEKTIERCIKSIEEQSHPVFELIVIDDASTDMTPALLGKLWGKYGNMRIFGNSVNLGKAASVNKVLDSVQTPLTAIVDADTFLSEEYLFRVLKAFYKEDVVGVSGTVLPSEMGNMVEGSRLIEYLHGQFTYKTLQDKVNAVFVLPGCCSVWRTEWLRTNKIPTDTVVEDMDMSWEAQIRGNKIAFVPDGVCYTVEPDSLSGFARQTNRWFSWRPVLKKHWKDLTSRMKVLIIWMLAESIGYLVWLAVTIYLFLSGQFLSGLLMFLIDIVIMASVSVKEGQKLGVPLKKVFSSLPRYYFLRIPTAFLFWKSFIKPKRSGW